MATTQRITPNTTTTTSSTVSNDKLKKGAMYGGAGVAVAAALAGAAYHIHKIMGDIVKPEADPNAASAPEELTADPVQSEVTSPVQTHPDPTPVPKPYPIKPDPNPDPIKPEPTPDPDDPNVIAQEIIGRTEIDVADINLPPKIQFDSFSVFYDEMGNECQAAIFHLDNGEQLKLVDLNHDGLFTEIFDLAGYQVGSIEDLNAPFYFTEEDIRFALENEIGYVGPAAEPGDSTMDLGDAAAVAESCNEVAMNVPAHPTAIGSVDIVDDIDVNDVDVQAIITSILDTPVDARQEAVITEDSIIIDDPIDIDDELDTADSDDDVELDDLSDTDILS